MSYPTYKQLSPPQSQEYTSSRHSSVVSHKSLSTDTVTKYKLILYIESLITQYLPTKVTQYILTVLHYIRSLPIVQYYHYMYTIDSALFYKTLFVNYGLPLITETLPYYFSRHKLAREIREGKNIISHKLLVNESIHSSLLYNYALLSVVYSLVFTVEETLKNRILLANKLLVKKLIIEKFLYSEIGLLQSKYYEIYNENLTAEQLEQRIFTDISDTINLFNNIIPSILRSAYVFYTSATDLLRNYSNVSVLFYLRPSVVGLIYEACNTIMEKYITDVQALHVLNNTNKLNTIISNIFNGIAEIQIFNIQSYQLQQLNTVITNEIDYKYNFKTSLQQIYKILSQKNLLDFFSEIAVIEYIKVHYNMSHEVYRQIQNDIDYSTRLFARLYVLCKDCVNIFDTQHRMITIINLPNFARERNTISLDMSQFQLHALTVNRVKYRYKHNAPYVLNIDKCITFERGKIYAIVGQNRCGKSTFVSLLCQIYKHKHNSITVNDTINFNSISRTDWRSILTYIPQKSFLFNGTISENIRIGNSTVSERDVETAARLAGVFLNERPKSVTAADTVKQQYINRYIRKPWQQNNVLITAYHFVKRTVERLQRSRHMFDDIEIGQINETALSDSILSDDVDVSTATSDNRESDDTRNSDMPDTNGDTVTDGTVVHPMLAMETTERGSNLSGGLAQSVALARVFLRPQAQLVILDESMSQMDLIKKNEIILPNLLQYIRQHNQTLLLISHDVAYISQYVDQIIVMDKGSVADIGTPSELRDRHSQPYMKLCGL